MNYFYHTGRLLLVSLLFVTSCISNKKHLEQVAAMNADFYQEIDALNGRLATAYNTLDSLRIALAEKRGANEALTAMQDKLLARIDELEDELELTTEKAQNRSASLNQELEKRERLIREKETAINDLKSWITDTDASLVQFAAQLADSLATEDSLGLIRLVAEKSELLLTIQESLLFKPGSFTLEPSAPPVLAKIASVLNKYPDKVMFVVGHTDNQNTGNRNLKESLDFSAVRAATLVRSFVRDYGVAANQLTQGAKGEYAPIASNETDEGRIQNRRIEIIISKNQSSLMRDLKRRVDKL
ncbi:MAG: OmpA family protein [Saprospiraceae bacterium]|jgi:chemotaxis protein MotB|nr:OmpA family protein [Saprospiraceae bacterium]MDP4821578.1 OmpA family protein [Saprospiraceae bacterium]MDP4999871.1 OmpA family protein [Saprospiraceae bacterium]